MKAERAARQHAASAHARAVADLHDDPPAPQPVPHRQLRRGRYTMEHWGNRIPVRIMFIEGDPYFIPPSGFPFDVRTVPDARFFPEVAS